MSEVSLGVIWTIIIGFVAGVIAKFIMPGTNEPQGFILTTIFWDCRCDGRHLPWSGSWGGLAPGEAAGFIGAVVGAIVVLLIWGVVVVRRPSAGF